MIVTSSSFLFRLLTVFHLRGGPAATAYFGRGRGDIPPAEAFGEVANLCCGAINRELARYVPHLGMSTPYLLHNRCLDFLSDLSPQHVARYDVAIDRDVRLGATLCLCGSAAIDFSPSPSCPPKSRRLRATSNSFEGSDMNAATPLVHSDTPVSKVLVLDESRTHAGEIKKFCQGAGLVPHKVRGDALVPFLAANIDLGGILMADDYGGSRESAWRVARSIRSLRPGAADLPASDDRAHARRRSGRPASRVLRGLRGRRHAVAAESRRRLHLQPGLSECARARHLADQRNDPRRSFSGLERPLGYAVRRARPHDLRRGARASSSSRAPGAAAT